MDHGVREALKARGKSHRTKPQPARQRRRRPWLLSLGAILVLTFAVYIPSLDNEFTDWDDIYYVAKNPLLAHPDLKAVLTTPIVGNYHPLTIASLALNYRLSGLNPSSYHWLTLLLHLANTALVFLFIRGLSVGRFWTTAVTTLFFGIHPMHVESVAWLAERKDVLYGFFYLIGLITYLRYLDRRGIVWLGCTLLAFLFSAASKPAAVVFPITLWAIDYYRRRPFNLAIVMEKVPFLAVSIAVGILTLSAQQSAGAIAEPHRWSLFQKLLFASYGTAMYGVKLILPVHLSAIYPYPNTKAVGTEFYLALAAVALLVPAVVYLFRRTRPVLFGLAFFFINIILVLQFFTVGQAVMADRYTYLPYIGLFFALAWWLDERSRSILGLPVRPLVAGCLFLLLPLSLYQTWARCDVWQNGETLWNDTIAKYPKATRAYLGRGGNRLLKGELAGAVADFSRSIDLSPRFWHAYANRALAYAKMREWEKSIADSRRAIEVDPKNSENYLEYGSMGEALQQLGRNDSAFVYFSRAIALNPRYHEALNNRGAIGVWRGDLAGAAADFSRAIAVNPGFRDAYTNRALVYAKMRDYEKSITDRRRAIELDPKNSENHVQLYLIGEALQQLNRPREAVSAYDEAIRTAPPNAPRLGFYYLRRSSAWSALGDRAKASSDAREAERLSR